jgi:subtilase family serine protease
MSTKNRPGLLIAVTGVLLGLLGCGAPSAEEAQAPRQSRQSLVTGPDFIVQEVSSPPSAWPGGSLPVQVTVCNQGTDGDAVNVELYLSQDAIISTLDTPIAGTFLGWIAPGQCITQSFPATASVPEGTWYPGALVDTYGNSAESDETNNGLAGDLMGVGARPDFIIEEVSGPPSVRPGQPFMASVRVCNQGTTSGAADMHLVLSEDTIIQFSYNEPPEGQDLPLTPFFTGLLEPGQCKTQQVQAFAQPPEEGAWYLGVVADPGSWEQELIESNNTRASEPVGMGWRPDFIIQSVKGPASVMPGQPFTASVRVCNQGTVSGATEVQLVLSEDAVIQFSYGGPPQEQDLPLMGFPVEPLEPGQCKTHSVETSVHPPSEGGWYLGAVSDPGDFTLELLEGNNTRASELTGMGWHPDFIIQSVKGPASVMPGQPFTASVTVCNQGTTSGHATAQLVLSKDTTIRFSYSEPPHTQDQPVTGFSVGPLEPGQCRTQAVEASVHPPFEGGWYLGAVADPEQSQPELLEGNNTRASEPVGMGWRPDLIIQSVSGPASAQPGQPFTASVTVCNQGTTSGHAEVHLVLSEDTDIRFSYSGPPQQGDLPLDFFYVGLLEPGQCKTRQAQVFAHPPYEGGWHLGAVVDAADSQLELLENNNAAASTVVGMGWRSDLIVQSVSGPASAQPGQPFTASVTVCNQGTTSGHAEVQLVLSEDTDIRFTPDTPPYEQDLPLNMLYLGMLDPGQCKTQQTQASAHPPFEGGWYLGAVVDPWKNEMELLEGNNARASEPVGMGWRSDLIVQSVKAPASVMPGQPFTASVTVCNQGTVGGGAEVRLVLSEDTDIRFSYTEPPYNQDMPLIDFYSGYLAAGQCSTQQVQVAAHPPYEGSWYLGAVADPTYSEMELIENNNTRASEPVGMGWRPDFIIQSVKGPASVMPGQPFTASVRVCNQGTMGGGTHVQLVLSEDATIRFSYNGPMYDQDMPLIGFYSGYLAAGQCSTQQVETSVHPPHEGGWYLGATADPAHDILELIENNNSRASVLIGMGWRPDLIVQSVKGPASVSPGQPFTASVTVCNQGTTSGHAEVQLVLSEDTDIRFSPYEPPSQQDMPLNMLYVGLLEPGQCTTQPVQASAHPPYEGGWYLGAVVDAGNWQEELLEGNNTRASEPVGMGWRPDYIIQSVSGPASVVPGQPFTASVRVCNQGTVSGGTEVMLVLSEDEEIRFSFDGPPEQHDMPLSSLYVGPLEAGQCKTEQVQISAHPPHEGGWHLGGVADPGNWQPELLEGNNTRASVLIGMGWRPDYIIQSVSGPVSVQPGQPFTASVRVCNQGTVSGGTEVMLVLSEDDDIRFSFNGPPEQQDMPLNSLYVGPLEPGQCKTEQVQVSAHPPHEGGWYLGGVADPGNWQEELLEGNNTRASEPVGMGWRPDYIIQSVSGPASVSPGQPFTASVTVCNQGTVGGGTEVQLVLSEDTTIRSTYGGPGPLEDLPLTSFGTGPLEPGQCVTQQVETSVSPPHEGAWHLGAAADPGSWEQELLEGNNTRASLPMGVGMRSDLVVQTVTGPDSTQPGVPFTAEVTVCNQGTTSGHAEVQLVLSEDEDIRFSPYEPPSQQDLPLNTFYLGLLEPGQCATQQVETSVSPPHEGGWYLGAVVDVGNWEPELLENNNSRASPIVGVGVAPDVVIRTLGGPASVGMGEPYGVTVRVCNQGTVSTSAEVQLVLSEDEDIRFSYSGPPNGQDLPIEYLFVDSLQPGQCLEQGVALNVWPNQPGGWYVGAVADPGQWLPELIEHNNTRASGVIQFHP